ncbi:MAG: hypothetical protein ABMA25_22960 [Ilumatobacteraceae bacterium]
MHADESTSATSSTRRLALVCSAVIVVVTTAVAIAIGTDRGAADREWEPPEAEDATVIYDVFDNETAPELQRNYRITMSEGSVRLAVYSYELMLWDETTDLPDDVWQRTLDAANDFHGTLSTPRDGCAEVDGNELTVYDRNRRVIQVYVDGCTQGERPDIARVITEVSELLDVDGQVAAADYDAAAEAAGLTTG